MTKNRPEECPIRHTTWFRAASDKGSNPANERIERLPQVVPLAPKATL